MPVFLFHFQQVHLVFYLKYFFLFKFFSLSSKSIFFTKLTISFLLVKFPCANFPVKFSTSNLLNFKVVIYLLWSGILLSPAVRTMVVVTKLLILGISFLTSFILALTTTVVANLVILGILFLTSFILALRVVLVAKSVISGVL